MSMRFTDKEQRGLLFIIGLFLYGALLAWLMVKDKVGMPPEPINHGLIEWCNSVNIPPQASSTLSCPAGQTCFTTTVGEVWYQRSYVDENLIVEIERGKDGQSGRVTLIRRCALSEGCVREIINVWPRIKE